MMESDEPDVFAALSKAGRIRKDGGRLVVNPKPTIAELQALLNSDDDTPVTIHADGSISEVGKPPPHTHYFAETLFSDNRGTERRCQCGARLWEPAETAA